MATFICIIKRAKSHINHVKEHIEETNIIKCIAINNGYYLKDKLR